MHDQHKRCDRLQQSILTGPAYTEERTAHLRTHKHARSPTYTNSIGSAGTIFYKCQY